MATLAFTRRIRTASRMLLVLGAGLGVCALAGAALGVCALAGAAPQTTDVFTAVADSYVAEGSPTQNYGSEPQLVVGYAPGNHRRSEIRFDISGIPADQMITSATLRVYVLDVSGGGATVSARQIRSSWNESTLTWSTLPDISPPPIDSTTVSTAGWATWDLTLQVTAWYTGADANYGVELGAPLVGDYSITMASREGVQKPELVVSYEPLPAGQPNLVITDIWPAEIPAGRGLSSADAAAAPDAGTVCCQVFNKGEVTAPPGYQLGISTDGGQSGPVTLTVTLPAQGRLEACFDAMSWTCSGASDTIEVCADSTEVVPETDEDDNCRTEVWQCDTRAPQIVAGPTVSGITADAATITWDTDEASDGQVRYGRTSGLYDFSGDDALTGSHHQLILLGLDPSAVYHFQVASADAAGNEAVSEDFVFETLPAADNVPPTVILPDPGVISSTVTLTATATDNVGVRKVEFYLDDVLLGADYTEPYETILESPSWGNGAHRARAVAYDFAGGSGSADRDMYLENAPIDMADPSVMIQSPADGETVERGPVTITAFAIDSRTGDLEIYEVDRVEFYVNGRHKETVTEPDAAYTYSYIWRTGGLAEGDYQIMVRAYDARDNSDSDSITLHVPEEETPPGEPVLEVTRLALDREDTHYQTGLRIENIGAMTVHALEVVDRLVGFQAQYLEDSVLAYEFDDATNTCEVTWHGAVILEAGEAIELQYKLAPILAETAIDYEIGSSTSISYEDKDGVSYSQELTIPETTTLHVEDRIASSNYLIITDPNTVLNGFETADANELLAWMARLAVEKEGVLGYLSDSDADNLKDLLEPGGDWGSQMQSGWPSGGHVLIVGETEIIPSQDIYDEDIEDAMDVYPVNLVDNWYADLSGSDAIPELAIGRILGEDAEGLIAPLQASLAGGFECDRALLVTGVGSGHSSFWWNTEAMQDRLQEVFPTVHWLDWENYDTASRRLAELREDVQDRDIIIFRGHGDTDEWTDALQTYNLPLDFGGTRPLVVSLACLTGDFQDADNIARAFMANEAGAFIGSSELSWRYANNDAGKEFTDRWPNGMNSGMALKQTKEAIIEDDPDDYRRLWAMEYNLYGDPKYGYCPGAAAAAQATAAAPAAPVSAPPTTVDVIVPDYTVSSEDGVDEASITGGAQLAVEGQPLVPIYAVTYDYAQGYEVQDVVLTARTGLTTTIGLNLPAVVQETDRGGSIFRPAPAAVPEGWYPQLDYTWDTHPNGDGTSTLVIRMYPFYYNALTTGVQFYRNYSFRIDTTRSDVQILDLTTDRHAYAAGEIVTAGVAVTATEVARDVVAQVLIRRYGSGKVVAGLLLQSLDGLRGQATFSQQWDTTGAARGDYAVEVTLTDASGSILDRRTAGFSVGICSGEITAFSATPKYFAIGDPVHAVLAFENTGSVVITGTARIAVHDAAGATVQSFSREIADLAPGLSQEFDVEWDTTGAPRGAYRVIGWVAYDARATDPVAAVVSTEWPRTYLPLGLKR